MTKFLPDTKQLGNYETKEGIKSENSRKIELTNLSVKSIPAQKHPIHSKIVNLRDKTLLKLDSAPLLFQDMIQFLHLKNKF